MLAAEKLFTSRRYHEVTLDDIVREVRIGKGTIYLYFKDKDDLFLQVALAGFDEMCALIRQRVADSATPREQLLQVCGVITAFFTRRRELFRMMQSEDARLSLCAGGIKDEWHRKRRGLVEAVAAILTKGQDAGVLRTDLTADVLAELLLGMLRARARSFGDSAQGVDDSLLVDLFLSGAVSQR